MEQSLKHKLAIGGLIGGLILVAGAVAGGAIGNDADDDRLDNTALTSAAAGSGEFVDLPDGTTQTFGAGPAGSVTIARTGGTLTLVSADPAAGWVVTERFDDDDDEVEVTFVGSGSFVRFDAELEDGVTLVRVRTNALATPGTTPDSVPGTTAGSTPGSTPGTTPGTLDDDDDDRSGHGRGGGHDDDDDDDNNRGHGGGDD